MNTMSKLIGVASLTLLCGSAQAALIAQYTSAASTSNPSISATDVASGISAAALTAGTGLVANAGGTWNWRGWDTASTSFNAAVAANDFWRWGLQINDNIGLNLTTMDIRLDRSGTGPDDFEIQAAVNGGAGVSLLTHDFADSDASVNFLNVDLSGIGALSQGDSLLFTFAAFNSESAGGTFDLENIGSGAGLILNGDISPVTAVPVPAAAWLMGSALLGFAGYRRAVAKPLETV